MRLLLLNRGFSKLLVPIRVPVGLPTAGAASDNDSVTRFTSECEVCSELLIEYITASNEIIDAKKRTHTRKQPSARQLASLLIDNALDRRNRSRKQLFTHKEEQH